MKSKRIVNKFHGMDKRILLVLLISILLIWLIALVWIGIVVFDRCKSGVEGAEDYLLYIAYTEQQSSQLMIYDVIEERHTPILPGWEINRITVNMKNRLAFLSAHDGELDVYILDYPFIENTPVNITHDVPVYEYSPISWSPDGRYLAYATLQDDGKTLWVWDGKRRLPIHDYQEKVGELTDKARKAHPLQRWPPNGGI